MFPERPRLSSPLAVGLIGAVIAFAAILPNLHHNTWLFRDGRFYTNVAVTITERLSLDQQEFCASWYDGHLGWNRDLDPGWSNVALGRNGEHWPKHNYVLPIAASPLVFAFGLAGTLMFNLMMLGVIAAGLFRFARAYVSPTGAAVAAIAFVFGSAIVGQNAYDFSTDVLLLAFFSQGLAALVDKAGARAGVLFGLAVVIRPTSLAYVLPLGIVAGSLAGRRPLAHAVGGGAVALLIAGAINTYLFGAPWLTGYQRTLVTVAGQPEVASHTDLFGVPFDVGLTRIWEGEYGLRQAFTVLAVALPGVLVLARKYKALTLASLLAVFTSVQIFARYAYEGHRFHWIALSFLVPALAAGIELVGKLPRVFARARTGLSRRAQSASFLAGVAAMAVWIAELPFGAPEPRLGAGPIAGAVRDALMAAGSNERNAAIYALLVHIVLGAMAVAALVRIGARVLRAEVVAAAVVAVAALPGVRANVESGGALFAVHGLAVLGLERITARRHVLGGVMIAAAIAVAAFTSDGALLFHECTSPFTALARGVLVEGPTRLALPIVALGLVGVGVVWLDAQDTRTVGAFAGLATLALVPGLATTEVAYRPIAALALAPAMAVALGTLVGALGTLSRGFRTRTWVASAVLALTVLLAIGGVRRVRAADGPFHLASYEGVRHALVFHEEVPCDFLAWEHMSWECSHLDSGLYGMFGLALSGAPIEVGHVPEPLAVLPTGVMGQTRRIVWPTLRAGPELIVRWAVPDGHRGDGELRVLVNDQVRATIHPPLTPDGWDRFERIDTHDVEGQTARLEITFAVPEHQHAALVGIDAAW